MIRFTGSRNARRQGRDGVRASHHLAENRDRFSGAGSDCGDLAGLVFG